MMRWGFGSRALRQPVFRRCAHLEVNRDAVSGSQTMLATRIEQTTSDSVKTSEFNETVDVKDNINGDEEKSYLKLKSIVRHLPDSSTSIGYGSGVFSQSGYKNGPSPQIDLIHVVEDTSKFHTANLALNRNHYSGLKYGGVWVLEMVQKLGAGLYYNPFVKINGSMVKYGVVSKSATMKDLMDWETLYIAGRLQKPVKFIGDDLFVKQINQLNLKSALVISILINQVNSTKHKLFETVTSLSYLGDIRMAIGGENPNKIRNIVSKQYHEFVKLYDPILKQLERENVIKVEGEEVLVELSDEKKFELIRTLPGNFQTKLFETYTNDKTVLVDKKLPKKLVKTLQKIVLYPSVVQSLKGVFTAGVYKSFIYVIEKRMKFLQRK